MSTAATAAPAGALFTKPSRAEIERRAREDYLKAFPKGRPEEPKLANATALIARDRPREFEFRGRRYVVPPIGYLEGVELQLFIQTELKKWQDQEPTWENMAAYVAVCQRAAEMLWSLCEPVGWRRFFKDWMRNPLMRGSDKELGELVGFFFECRMTSSVRLPQAMPRS